LKALYNNFIINLIKDIFFNVYNQIIIHLLISNPILQSTLVNMHGKKKTLSTIAVVTGKNNNNLISIYTNKNNKFFIFIIFSSRLTIPSISENSSSLHRSTIYIKLITKYHKVHYREFIGIKKEYGE